MTFQVEDGSGLADANSYIDISFANSYFADRGIVAWTGTDNQKKTYLIQATDYIDKVFGSRFIGTQANPGVQALAWPRFTDPLNSTLPAPLPVNLQKACAEYALRVATAPLVSDPIKDPSGFEVTQHTAKVGQIEESKSFATRGSGGTFQPLASYPAADLLLRDLLVVSYGRTMRN